MPEKDCIAPTNVKSLLNGAKILAITLGADEVKEELLHGVGAAKLVDKMDLADQLMGFESDEAILQELGERLRSMTDEELIRFGKDVRRLAENPFQRQLEEARKEWKRREKQEKQHL